MSKPRDNSKLLAIQSEWFHAFEWVRGEAMKGNPHAAVILDELVRLKNLRAKEALRQIFGD